MVRVQGVTGTTFPTRRRPSSQSYIAVVIKPTSNRKLHSNKFPAAQMFPTEYLIMLVGTGIFIFLGVVAQFSLPSLWRAAKEDVGYVKLP